MYGASYERNCRIPSSSVGFVLAASHLAPDLVVLPDFLALRYGGERRLKGWGGV